MNIELKPRMTPFSIPTPASANDNAERRRESEPRRRAVIYKPAKSVTTSGRAGTKRCCSNSSLSPRHLSSR